jgi:hypothetical protein
MNRQLHDPNRTNESGVQAANPVAVGLNPLHVQILYCNHYLFSRPSISRIMSNLAINGDYDASVSSRGDNLKQAAAKGSASSPLTDLETADVLQSIRDWTNDTKADTNTDNTDTDAEPSAAVLPAELALSLDLYQRQQDQASYYWDASTMAPLNVVSAVSKAVA